METKTNWNGRIHMRKTLCLLLAGLMLLLTACGGAEEEAGRLLADALTEAADSLFTSEDSVSDDADDWAPAYGGYYYDVENVVLYLTAYGELPPNYITKDEARDLGWQGGSVEDYLDGAAIGGDRFGNYGVFQRWAFLLHPRPL